MGGSHQLNSQRGAGQVSLGIEFRLALLSTILTCTEKTLYKKITWYIHEWCCNECVISMCLEYSEL